MRRPLDLAAVALVLAAGLFIVEATWAPPLVGIDEAAVRIGERVRMEGMALDIRRFSDGTGRMVLSADGTALHVHLASAGAIEANDWVRVEGTLRRDGGLPLLDAEKAAVVARPDMGKTPLSAIAQRPASYLDTLLHVQGFVQRGMIEDDGHRVAVDGDVDPGFQAVQGVLRYEARCLCYTLHVAPWTP